MLPDLKQLTEIVTQVAQEEAVPRFAKVPARHKADGSVITEVDLAIQQRLQAYLVKQWPDYALLGEEMEEAEQQDLLQNHTGGLWCLDPLDGTSNFASGVPFFSLSLGLLVAGRPILGVIYDPMRQECFSAEKGQGAWLNGAPLLRSKPYPWPLKKSIAVVDFKRLQPPLGEQLVRNSPFGSQRNFGSCALEWCWLAAGRFQVYLHGGQKLWDYAAGSLILQEAGGVAQNLEGEAMTRCDELKPRSAVAAVDGKLFEQWRAAITELVSGKG